MDTTGLDLDETKKDFSLELEKSLKASPLLSKIFILLLNNPTCDVNETCLILKKSHGHIYSLFKRLNNLNVARKVEGKSKFYINKNAFPESTWLTLRQDALATIKAK